MKSFLLKSRVYLQLYEIRIGSSLYHMEPGTLLACLVVLFAAARLLVDFFLVVAARFFVGRSFAREGWVAVFVSAVARADFFWVAVEPRRAVLVAVGTAALAVRGFLCVTLLVDVPSCRGFSSVERCTATTSL
jgi:hypothetical protein